MNRTCCAAVAVAAVLITGGCSATNSDAADDTFIAELSVDAYWKTVDRATAITAGHDFCDAVIEANKQGKTGIDAVTAVLTRYGLKPGPVLFGAAKKNYCPDVDLG